MYGEVEIDEVRVWTYREYLEQNPLRLVPKPVRIPTESVFEVKDVESVIIEAALFIY